MLALGSALLLVACGDEEQSEPPADGSTPIAEAAAATPPRTATPGSTPEPAPTPETARAIGNTDGNGVAFRSACSDDARTGGAWPEGAVVSVTGIGDGKCTGWALVEAGGVTSWVREQYLVLVELLSGAEHAVVSNIIDGDTIDVLVDGEELRVRLILIAAPEPSAAAECYDFPTGSVLSLTVDVPSATGPFAGSASRLWWTSANMWNNSSDDDAVLYDCAGAQVSYWDD